MPNKKYRITYKDILTIIAALILTGLSFLFFFLFQSLPLWAVILICVLDFAFTLYMIFGNFFVKLVHLLDKKLKFKSYKPKLLFIFFYFLLFYLISLIIIDSISWEYFSSIFPNCVFYSFFAFPSFFLTIPLLLLIGYGLGE